MKNLIKTLVALFLLLSVQGFSQCNVQTSNGSNGSTFKYLNAEMVGTGTGCEMGVSISTNGANYFFNTNVRYAKKSVKSDGTLVIVLKNNQSLNLKHYSCQVVPGKTKNSDVVMSVYTLAAMDIEKLKKASIEKIVFTEVGGKDQSIVLSKNFDVATRHLKCLE